MELYGTGDWIDWSSAIGFGALWGLFLFLAYVSYTYRFINNILLYKFGVECKGTVSSKRQEVERTRRNGKDHTSTTYYVTIKIKYSDDMNATLLSHDNDKPETEKEMTVDEGQYDKYNEGDIVRYIYLKSFPSWDKIDDTNRGSCAAEICSCCITDTICNVIFMFILWNGLGATFLWIASKFGGYICMLISIAWCTMFMCLCQCYCLCSDYKKGENARLDQEVDHKDDQVI